MLDCSSLPFVIEALENAPFGALTLREKQVIWLNQRLAGWLGLPKEQCLGLTAQTCETLGLTVLFETSERFDLPSSSSQLHIRRQVVHWHENVEIHYLEDVSALYQLEKERDQLRKSIRVLEVNALSIGIANRNAILKALDIEVSRSRRYGNALSVIRLSVLSASDPDMAVLRHVAQEINSQLRWVDQVGQFDPTTYLLVLPETPVEEAEVLAARLSQESTPQIEKGGWTIDFAVAGWQKGDDSRKLLRRIIPKPTQTFLAP
jgi:GGDEF domain-containing protein